MVEFGSKPVSCDPIKIKWTKLHPPFLLLDAMQKLFKHGRLKNTMQLLETIDGSPLQELHICRINEWLDQLRRVAALS